MNPGATVDQWIPTYNSGVNDTWSMIRTFIEVFNYAVLFLNEDDGIILGSNEPIQIDPTKLLPERAIHDMRRLEFVDIYSVLGNYICSRDKLMEMCRDYPIITDDHPTLEFTAPISHWQEDITGPVNMKRQFLEITQPVDEILKGNADYERARLFQKSRMIINEAYIADKTGDTKRAHELYLQAYRNNPEDIKSIRELFMFLRAHNILHLLPDELKFLMRPPKAR